MGSFSPERVDAGDDAAQMAAGQIRRFAGRLTILAFVFTLAEARHLLADLRPLLDDLIARRADLAELRADLATGRSSPLGGLAEAKALEAQLHSALEEVAERGVEVRGYAPLLLDFPGARAGRPVSWCWLEGDAELAWYHRVDCGFPGRRPL